MTVRRLILPLFLSLALTACGQGEPDGNLYALDEELVAGAANGTDPLLAAAVNDPIMSDPQLSTRSNADSIRPPLQPYSAAVPAPDSAPDADADDGALTKVPDPITGACRQCAIARDAITLGALAARQTDPRTKSCASQIRYAAGWANRLPAGLALHPGAHVIEAAGAETPQCHVRAVTVTVRRPVAHMLDWYYTRAAAAGYTTEHQADDTEHALAGSRGRDGAAYVAFLRDDGAGGTEIDLLTSTAR